MRSRQSLRGQKKGAPLMGSAGHIHHSMSKNQIKMVW